MSNRLTDKLSPELRILVSAMRHATSDTGGTSQNAQEYRSALHTFDNDKLLILATNHNIRPLLSIFTELQPYLVDRTKNILTHIQLKSIRRNLKLVHVYHKIYESLTASGISVLPMKGNLFVAEYYRNNQLREMGDLDILIPPDQVVKAMGVLKSVNILPDFGRGTETDTAQSKWLHKQLSSKSQCEARFKSEGQVIDLHWEVSQPHYFQRLGYEQLFQHASIRDFFGKQVLLPHSDHVFWMLLTHHGGKESWLRLRHLVDLHLAMKHHYHIKSGAGTQSTAFNYDQVIDAHLIDMVAGWQLGSTFQDGIAILKGLELDGVARDESGLSARHEDYLSTLWNHTDRRSFSSIMMRNFLRYMRRDHNVSSTRYFYSYARNVFSNRVTR